MNVYVVTEETGSYSQTGWAVVAVFDNRATADRYIANMAALPGITSEYGAGSEKGYEVVEAEVWPTLHSVSCGSIKTRWPAQANCTKSTGASPTGLRLITHPGMRGMSNQAFALTATNQTGAPSQ